MSEIRAVCVYCGSAPGADPAFMAAARTLGELLAERRITLVYGGGRVGLMGAVADAALAAGGEVVGIIPAFLADLELAHTAVTQLHVVTSMHERKQLMADLADGFLALPGGLGTLEELVELATWVQLGMIDKPIALVDVNGFWGPLLTLLDHMVEQRLLRPRGRAALLVESGPQDALDTLTRSR